MRGATPPKSPCGGGDGDGDGDGSRKLQVGIVVLTDRRASLVGSEYTRYNRYLCRLLSHHEEAAASLYCPSRLQQ